MAADVDLTDTAQLDVWLMGQERHVSVAVAARSALRVLPVFSRAFGGKFNRKTIAQDIILPAFRMMALALAAAKYPAKSNELRVDIRARTFAADAADNSDSSVARAARAARAAIDAVATADGFVYGNASAANARASVCAVAVLHAVNDAFRFAFTAEVHSGAIAVSTIAAALDAKFIDSRSDKIDAASRLASLPLWQMDLPAWLTHGWGRIRTQLDELDEEKWSVWIDWYKKVLAGSPTPGGEELDIYRVTLGGEDDWSQGPAYVNSLIAQREREIAERDAPVPSDETQQVDLSQRPSGHVFDVERERVVAREVHGSVADPSLADEIRLSLVEKLNELADRLSRTQAPRRYTDSARRGAEFLAATIAEQLPLGRFLMIARSLESDWTAISSPDGRKEFAADLIATSDDVVQSLDDFKALFPELAKIEAARLALKLVVETAVAANIEATRFSEATKGDPAVDDSAQRALDEVAAEIEIKSAIIEQSSNDIEVAKAIEDRAALTSQRIVAIRNFAARSLKALGKRTLAAAGEGYDEAIKDSTKGLVKAGIGLVLLKVSGPFTALAVYVASLRPIAQKVEELKNDQSPDDTVET